MCVTDFIITWLSVGVIRVIGKTTHRWGSGDDPSQTIDLQEMNMDEQVIDTRNEESHGLEVRLCVCVCVFNFHLHIHTMKPKEKRVWSLTWWEVQQSKDTNKETKVKDTDLKSDYIRKGEDRHFDSCPQVIWDERRSCWPWTRPTPNLVRTEAVSVCLPIVGLWITSPVRTVLPKY